MLKGYKTLIFAALTALLGIATTFDWTSVVNQQTAGYILTAVGVVTGILRFFTTGSVGEKP